MSPWGAIEQEDFKELSKARVGRSCSGWLDRPMVSWSCNSLRRQLCQCTTDRGGLAAGERVCCLDAIKPLLSESHDSVSAPHAGVQVSQTLLRASHSQCCSKLPGLLSATQTPLCRGGIRALNDKLLSQGISLNTEGGVLKVCPLLGELRPAFEDLNGVKTESEFNHLLT